MIEPNVLTSRDQDFLKFVGKQESQFIQTKDHWRDQVHAIFNGDAEALGDFMPWSKTHHYVRFRPGEVTVWAGGSGGGKSLISGQVGCWLSTETKVLMASLEMKPEATFARMIRQASGGNNPTSEYIDKWFNLIPENLWLYDQLDSVESDRILGMVQYAAQELGIKHIFIDSLMKCGIGTDDYNKQKDFVDRICWAAKSNNIHIHLIHHIRKTAKATDRPDKYSVRGASEIVDLVDNLMICWRNKIKEEEVGRGGEVKESDPDLVLTVAKQRHGEWEGDFLLWFHPGSQQFIPKPNAGPMPFNLEGI